MYKYFRNTELKYSLCLLHFALALLPSLYSDLVLFIYILKQFNIFLFPAIYQYPSGILTCDPFFEFFL